MSLPRSEVNTALASIGMSRSDLFDFWSGARLDIDWFDPRNERIDVLTGLFGVVDMGAFPSSLSESKSESELELQCPHGNLATISGGKESSSEESSESVSQPPATAHGPYRNGFSVSSLCLDRTDAGIDSSSESMNSRLPLAGQSESPASISSHIVSVNFGSPVHLTLAALSLSPSSSESEVMNSYLLPFGYLHRFCH